MYEKIIMISLDTLRSDCLFSNKRKLYTSEYVLKNEIKKAKIDEIIENGFFFNNVITAAPYTSASHASIFSGLRPKNNGLYDQFNSTFKSKNIFELLKNNGYKNAFKTDFPFILGKYLNLCGGVENYYIEDDDSMWQHVKDDNKKVLFFHFGQIHYPYGFHSLKYGGETYKEKLLTLEKKYGIKSEINNLEDMAIETFRSTEDLSYLFRYKNIIHHLYKNGMDNDLFDLYVEGINYFNETKFNPFLEKLLNSLEDKKYLLVFFSDHGEARNSDTYGHHNSTDEGVLRVPLIFYGHNIKKGLHENRVRTIDILPTINKLVGNNDDGIFDGKSLDKIILHNDNEGNRDAFSAVWVNELRDTIRKTKKLLEEDTIDSDEKISLKYSETLYTGDTKYIRYYLKFINRSEKVLENNETYIYKIDETLSINAETNGSIPNNIKEEMDQYNDVKLVKVKETDENMKKYFNLQGYKI